MKQYRGWIKTLVCLVCTGLFVGVPYGIAVSARSNGLGAGLYVLSLFVAVPLLSVLLGAVSGTEKRPLWWLPVLPCLLFLLLWSVPGDGYFLWRAMPFLSVAAGYLVMLMCHVLWRKRHGS